jgi:uncharacterized protein
VKDQLCRLLVLQNHDINVKDLEKEREILPKEVESMRKDVEELNIILQKEISSLEEIIGWKTENEAALTSDEDRIQKRLKDLDKVTSGRDYFDLQKELEFHKKKAKDHELEIIQLMERVDQREKIVVERKQQLADFFKSVEAKEKSVAKRLTQIDKEYTDFIAGREEMLPGISKNLLRKYDLLSKRRFPPMVEAVDERCTGCNMGIPPQKFNSLYEVKEIVECPFCTRIIYIEETLQ